MPRMSPPIARIVPIGIAGGQEPTLDQPRPDRHLQGAPWRKTWLQHEAGPMGTGVWECEPVCKHVVLV